MLTPRCRLSLGALILASLLAACSGSSPSAPTPPAIAQVTGQWRFAVRITGITGGDCLSTTFNFNVNRVFAQTLTLQDDGSSLTGRVPGTVYGVDCNLTGTATQNGISLRTPACAPLGSEAAPAIPVSCLSGGELMITSPAVAADITLNGGTGTGTYSETFNVTTPTGQPGSPMTLNGTVTMTHQ